MKIINAFRFCPRCQKKIKKLTDRLVSCFFCGFHFYLSPSITNAAILENKQGEILLVKRKLSPKKGFWDLPGGFIEFKETIETSIKREIKEELGVVITNLQYFSSYPGRYFYKGLLYITLCCVFLGKINNQQPKAGDDAQSLRFFRKEKIPFKKLAFVDVKQALKEYIKYK